MNTEKELAGFRNPFTNSNVTLNITSRSKAEPNPIVPDYSGLEKIEPLAQEIMGMNFTAADMNIINKLNEVIEKVNLMMEVMNKGVK